MPLPAWKEELLLREDMERRNAIREAFFDRQCEVLDCIRGEMDRARELVRGLDPATLDPSKLLNLAPKPVFVKTPRRGSKTTCTSGIQIDDAQRNPGMHYPFIAITGPAARQFAWPVFKWWRDEKNIPLDLHEGDLSWRLPNGASGKLWGADRDDLQRNLLGGKNRIVVVDEAAWWKTDLGRFHRDFLQPTVADHMGVVIYASAPSDVLRGWMYDHTRDDDPSLRLRGGNTFCWGTDENPYMRIQLALLRKQWEADDPHYEERPWYKRQWLGLWVPDAEDTVWTYLAQRNAMADWARTYGERFVLAMDTGYTDGMAYVVLSYHPEEHNHVVVWESAWYCQENEDQIAARIAGYLDRYGYMHMVGDPSNAQLLADLAARYKLGVSPAEKTDKKAWIRITNTSFTNSTILVRDPEGANAPLTLDLQCMKKRYSSDTEIVTHDDGTREVVGSGEWEIDEGSAPGHCAHAMLYGFRYCYPYLHKEKPIPPRPGTPEHAKMVADQMREERMRHQHREARAKRRKFFARFGPP